MNRSNKKLYILITIISLLIMFFLFPLNGHSAQLEDFAIPEYTTNLEYTGENVYLNDLTISYKGNTLVENDDYTISYNGDDYITLGTKTATITIINSDEACVFTNNTKTLEISYKVCISIENAEFEALEGGTVSQTQSGSIVSFEYGSNTLPINLKVTHEGTVYTLVYGTDFTCEPDIFWYQVGMGGNETYLKGIGDYAGECRMWFELTAKSILSSDVRYEADSNAYYDGENNPYLGIIIYDDSMLDANKVISSDNYEITYTLDSENRIGIAKVEGKLAYTGSFNVEFKLASRRWGDDGLNCDIDWDIEREGLYYMYYSEDGIDVNFTLTDTVDGETYTLVKGTDYDYSIDEASDGSYNLIINLKDNYFGKIIYTFNTLYKITKNDPKLEVDGLSSSGYSLGMGQTYSPSPVIKYDGQEISNDYYNVTITVKDSEGNVHTNGVETGISSSDADGSFYTAYVTIEFSDKYSGVITYEVIIGPRIDTGNIVLLDDGILEGNTISYYYTGQKIVPSFNIELEINSDDKRILKLNEDFIITNLDELPTNVDPDDTSFDLYIEGIGNYAGGLYYSIKVKAINSDDLIFDVPEYVQYTGEEITLDLVIKDANNNTLVEGTDYSISYENNTEIGNANYFIEFMGNYTGEREGAFRIISGEITIDDPNLEVTGISDTDYYLGSNSTIKPEPTVKYNDVTLSSDEYEVVRIIKDDDGNEYEDGVPADAATGQILHGYVTINFIGTYAGSVTYTYEIKPSIENSALVCLDDGRIDGNTIYYSYTGSVIRPSFGLLMNIKGIDTTLVYGTDFVLNNDENPLEVGPELVEQKEFILKGIGNYGGWYYVHFTVEAKDISSNDISIEHEDNCYVPRDSTTYEFKIKIYDETIDKLLVLNEDYNLGYNLGTDTVTITVEGVGLYGGEISFTVKKATAKLIADIVDITYETSHEDYNAMYYTGSETHPDIKLAINDTELVLDTDYSISYDGDYSYDSMVTLTILGLNSFYGTLTYNYKIYSPIFEDLEESYSGNKKVLVLLEEIELAEYFNDIDNIDITGIGEYEITATLKPGYVFYDNEEYSLSGSFKLNVISLEITDDFNIEIESLRYTKEAQIPTITIIDYYDNVLEENKDYKVTITNNVNVGSGNVLIQGLGNYSGELNLDFDILGKNLEADDIEITKEENSYVNEADGSYYFDYLIHDKTFDYDLVKDTDYEIGIEYDEETVYFYITGINNYDGRLVITSKRAFFLITDDNISITYDDFNEGNIMYLANEEAYPIIKITYDTRVLQENTDYSVTYEGKYAFNSIVQLHIKGINNFYFKYDSSFKVEAKAQEVNEILEEAATDIISSATKSADLDLDSINFEDLTGLSKKELLLAKEYYNNLEQYIIDNKLDETVNKRLEDQGYSIRIEAADLASKLKEYLDTYATNVGYTNFNSQVDDVINALTVEDEKENIKEELLAYVHKHITPGTLNPIHNSSSNQNENYKNDNEHINSLIDEQLGSVKYEQCLDDSLRDNQYNNTIEKIHEIKNVSISIIKHTQSQTIANNNIEAYYNELVESGKYNEAQLALLKEVFDEMQEEVLELLHDGNINSQEELDKIVLKAIEKLSGVPITNISAVSEDGLNVNVSSSTGMASNTQLEINYASKNVSLTISRAINNKKITGKEDGILLIKNKDVKEAYDIDLVKDGNVIKEFEGYYTIKILLTDELKAFNNLQIIYIAKDGSVEVCDTFVEGDYLVFTTTHFSTYYLLGDKVFDFAPIIKILLAVIVSLIIFIVYLVLKIKNKKINQLGFAASLVLVPLSSIISVNVLVVSIVLGAIAFILLIVAILLAIKDYKIDRRINDEE